MIIREPYAAGGTLFPLLVRRFERLDDASPWAAAEGVHQHPPSSRLCQRLPCAFVRCGWVMIATSISGAIRC